MRPMSSTPADRRLSIVSITVRVVHIFVSLDEDHLIGLRVA